MATINTVKGRLTPTLILGAVLIFIGFSLAFPQGANLGTIGENTDLWRVRGNATYPIPPATGGAWRVDSLWMGPTFLRDTTKRFIVWFAPYFKTQATYKGKLYIMVPRPGLTDTAIFLFRNRCNAVYGNDSTVDLSTNPLVTANIHHLDTVYFMYRSDSGTSGPADCGAGWALGNDFGVKQNDSLFTGQNRAPLEGWIDIDRRYSLRNLSALLADPNAQNKNLVVDTFFSLSKNKYVKFGRRWCVAGWVHQDTIPNAGSNKRTDTVEFGFEDQYNGFAGVGGGMLYNDIRFCLTGVIINYPIRYDSLILRMTPNVDTIQAGDSINFYRSILYWTDSNLVAHVDSTNLVSGVTWRLAKSAQSGSYMRITTASPTNTFKAISAYETDTIVATLFNRQRRKVVYVKPAADARVWIEPDTLIDTKSITPAMLVRLQTPDSVASDTITSLQNQVSVFGVVRDQYGNFTRFANNALWTESPATGIVTAANGTPPFVGVITRANVGTTTVLASGKNLVSGANLLSSTIKVTVIAIPLNNLIDNQTFSVAERSAAGTLVDTIKVVPASMNVTLIQAPLAPLPAEFKLDATNRIITVNTNAVLNYKNKSTYSFKLIATAPNAFNDTATITINLIELIPLANLIDDKTFSVKEKSPGGTVVGTYVQTVAAPVQVTLTPVDSVQDFVFGPTGTITVKAGAVLNYDAKSSYSFRVQALATNAYAIIDTATITIRLVADSLIPVTATLLDTNHNGHIDMIDIKWTDPSTMKTTMPTVAELIRTLSMVTLSNQNDPLHAISLAIDTANKMLHIIIQENTQFMETGWSSAQVILNTVLMSVKGGYFQVTQVIDGAPPIVTAACSSPGASNDSLSVTFSEPLASTGTAGYLQTIIVTTKTGPAAPLSGLGATMSGATAGTLNFLVPAGAISPYESSLNLSFAPQPASPLVEIVYCHPLPLIVTGKAGPNPFDPNVSVPPGIGAGDPAHGIRIEILLNSANTSALGGENRPGTCTIFDAVGNVILHDAVLKPDPAAARKKYFIWDGKNRNGMAVAGGTYLARLTVEDKKSGSKVMTPIKIGVKTVK